MADLAGSSTLTLDVAPALAALDKYAAASDAVSAAVQANQAATAKTFFDTAKAANQFSDALANQVGEQRAAVAATQSAREELRRLTDQQKELTAAQSKTNSTTAEYQRLKTLLEQNRVEIQKAKQAINENTQATRDEKTAVEALRESRRQVTNETKLEAAAARQGISAQREAAQQAKERALAEKKASDATDKEVRSADLLVQLTRQLADLTERRARATTKEEAQGYNKQITDTKGKIGELTGELEKAGKSGGVLSGVLGKLGAAAVAAFTVDKILEVGREIEEVTAKFEKYRITLTGAFEGNQGRADRALIQVRNFADANGLEIEGLTDTYVKLVNRGIIPTTNQLRQLSDIAATSGKSTDQFVEALLDAQTGEFERLKEFGLKVKNNGDTLTFTFRGVKQEVKNTQDAITQYLYALGDQQGVQGQAAAQLKGLSGASIEAKNGITELFQVIGERSKGIFTALTNATGGAARALANFFKSTDQAALEQSASGIDRYAKLVGVQFDQVAALAKARGGDVQAAVKAAADDQAKFIDAKLGKARRDLAAYYKSAAEASAQGGGEVDAVDPAQVARYKTAIKLYEGQREAAQRAYKASVDGATAEKEEVGRIVELRKKIAAEEKARDNAPDTNAGNKERLRLVAQLLVDNKELNELLGKQDKVQKAAADKLATALKALYAERATLQSLAQKAAIKDSDDQAARAKLAFEEALRQAELIKQKLIEKELAVKKAGGRGANADGQIDGVQEAELAKLRVAALDAYYAELGKIEVAREQRLFELRAESDAKEVEQINRKYDAKLKAEKLGQAKELDALDEAAGKLAGQSRPRTQEALDIEEARQREQLVLKARQNARDNDQAAQLGQNVAGRIGETFGAGTGISVFEAKRAEKKMLLDIEQQHAEAVLQNSRLLGNKEGEIQRAAAEKSLATVRQQQKVLALEEKLSQFSIYKLIFGENDSPELRKALDEVASTVASSLGSIVDSEEKAAAARAQTATQTINELTGQLAAQIQLNEAGSASNIKGLQDQIVQERAIRHQALEDQRTAAKEKVLIDTLSQASSIATAAAEVFATFAAIPFIGIPLGIAAAAVLVGAFAASKVQAYQAASQIGAGSYFVGGFTGEGDARQESQAVGPRPYTYHAREFVMNHELTDDFRHPLFEPLHQRRPQDIDWSTPAMRELLPDFGLPARLQAERTAHYHIQQTLNMEPVRAELRAVRAELAEIKASNGRMADKPDLIPLGEGRFMERTENGGTHTIIVR